MAKKTEQTADRLRDGVEDQCRWEVAWMQEEGCNEEKTVY